MSIMVAENSIKEFSKDGQDFLFHVESSALFHIDDIVSRVLKRIRSHDRNSFASDELEIIEELKRVGIIRNKGEQEKENSIKHKKKPPLTALILNVNTGCNLSCSYCYKEDLVKPSDGQKMSYETAAKSVDLLMKESDDEKRVSLVFFGGEPLTNMSLIKETVHYANQQAKFWGKIMDYSITTNATMLTPKLADFFLENHFGITVSIDGPKKIHDKNRHTVSGKGTYDLVAKKIQLLLERKPTKPIGARVTLTHGLADIELIFDHLRYDLGLHEVGFSPVTSGELDTYNMHEKELLQLYKDMRTLGDRYLKYALNDQALGFTNMEQMLRSLHEGTNKQVPCGAGMNLLAVDGAGDLNLCHRFTGSDMVKFGNVDTGFNKSIRNDFIETAANQTGRGCKTCWLKNICSGGCYHESYTMYDDPFHPTYHHCDMLREWMAYGLQVYVEIAEKNPKFLNRFSTSHEK